MYSGKFVIRVPRELHGLLAEMSRRRSMSLNRICNELISKGLSSAGEDAVLAGPLNKVAAQLKKKFRNKLVGVVLFGSSASGEATESSDVDLLVILEAGFPITRSLYAWWDDAIAWDREEELNPHFVGMPDASRRASSLWLEAAENSEIIFQREGAVDKIFNRLRQAIAKGGVRRYSSAGHPYWVWSEDEE